MSAARYRLRYVPVMSQQMRHLLSERFKYRARILSPCNAKLQRGACLARTSGAPPIAAPAQPDSRPWPRTVPPSGCAASMLASRKGGTASCGTLEPHQAKRVHDCRPRTRSTVVREGLPRGPDGRRTRTLPLQGACSAYPSSRTILCPLKYSDTHSRSACCATTKRKRWTISVEFWF